MTDQLLLDARATTNRSDAAAQTGAELVRPYAYYALLLLVLANFFNYIDRQVLSIIGHRLQIDLQLSDAQLGFLMGTAFAVFYGVVGIAMGRIADALPRTRVMALGLAVWSLMTALGGLATNFAGLASARLGTGVGEATANPCSHSLLSDYFPARHRSVVLATYLVGTHLGLAASMMVGGLLLQNWGTLCTVLPDGACQLADWRATLLVVGLPGLVLAMLIGTLREPFRPKPPRRVGVARLIVTELSAAVPPFTLLNLFQVGGAAAVVRNILFAAALSAGAVGLSVLLGDWLQWAAVALGTYSVTTWSGVMRRRDRPLFSLTFGCRTFVLATAGCATLACFTGPVQIWAPGYAMRVLGANPGEAGVAIGLATAISAGLSVVVGGFAADRWKRRDSRAPIWICLLALFTPIPALLVMLHARDLHDFVAAYSVFVFLSMTWAGAAAALVQDLVLPRMRGTTAAAFALVQILVSGGIGPYWVGKVSTMTGSLSTGLHSLLVFVPLAAVLLFAAARRLPADNMDSRRALAAQAGEVF
jgi:MFS family permease